MEAVFSSIGAYIHTNIFLLVDTSFFDIFKIFRFLKVEATFLYSANAFFNKSFIRLVETDFLSSGDRVFWSELFFCYWKPLLGSGMKQFSKKELTRPTFQRRINVVSTLWINIEITLIRRWKWNKIRRRIFNVAQRWYNVGVRRWNNVETTFIQLYLDVASACPQH